MKIDPSVEADGEEAHAKCRQCEVEEKIEKMMVAQSELLMRITELETALVTEQEKTRAIGQILQSAEEALAKLNKGAAYGEKSRDPATRTVEKKEQASKKTFSRFNCRKAQLQQSSYAVATGQSSRRHRCK